MMNPKLLGSMYSLLNPTQSVTIKFSKDDRGLRLLSVMLGKNSRGGGYIFPENDVAFLIAVLNTRDWEGDENRRVTLRSNFVLSEEWFANLGVLDGCESITPVSESFLNALVSARQKRRQEVFEKFKAEVYEPFRPTVEDFGFKTECKLREGDFPSIVVEINLKGVQVFTYEFDGWGGNLLRQNQMHSFCHTPEMALGRLKHYSGRDIEGYFTLTPA